MFEIAFTSKNWSQKFLQFKNDFSNSKKRRAYLLKEKCFDGYENFFETKAQMFCRLQTKQKGCF